MGCFFFVCVLFFQQAKQRPAANVAVPAAPSQLHQMAGYFAIVGMSRLQCLLGDYYECEFCLSLLIDGEICFFLLITLPAPASFPGNMVIISVRDVGTIHRKRTSFRWTGYVRY